MIYLHYQQPVISNFYGQPRTEGPTCGPSTRALAIGAIFKNNMAWTTSDSIVFVTSLDVACPKGGERLAKGPIIRQAVPGLAAYSLRRSICLHQNIEFNVAINAVLDPPHLAPATPGPH